MKMLLLSFLLTASIFSAYSKSSDGTINFPQDTQDTTSGQSTTYDQTTYDPTSTGDSSYEEMDTNTEMMSLGLVDDEASFEEEEKLLFKRCKVIAKDKNGKHLKSFFSFKPDHAKFCVRGFFMCKHWMRKNHHNKGGKCVEMIRRHDITQP